MGTVVPTALRDDRWSPELALVCPELREQAIAALPDYDPDAFLPRGRPEAPEFRLLRSIDLQADTAADRAKRERRTPLPVAILAYAAQRTFIGAVEATAAAGLLFGAMAATAALRS